MSEHSDTKGLAVLVGAGPGDSGLISVAGANWIRRADVIIYDRLVGPELLDLARPDAERIYVGKDVGRNEMPQERINAILVEKTRQGRLVVRLKGGDPLIFGRGGEEADALLSAGLEYRIVPGITAAIAAGAFAGIPLTDRRLASSVAFVTGHEDPAKETSSLDWKALAGIDTLVLYMGVGNLAAMAERLIKAGKSPDTPAAVIEQATLPRQRVTVATLNTIADAAQQAGVRPPAITIVGRVVELRSRLAWLEKLPLHGQCVLVTRSRPQASRLSQRLRELGAEVIEAPTIAIEAPKDCRPLDSALRRLKEFHLLALTSPNGVAAVFDRLRLLGLDARALANLRVAAVGSETAAELLARGIAADIVPEEYTTAAMAQAIRQSAVPAGSRVLLARADIATPELADALAKGGFFVEEAVAYRTVRPESLSGEAKDALAAGRVNWITFTSSSTVENFLALVDTPEVLRAIKLASIGPVTSQTLRKHGHAPTVEAQTHTIDALADAMATYQRKKHSG